MLAIPAATPATKRKTQKPTPKRSPTHLRVGDKVRLISGNIAMCVIRIQHDGSIRCAWHDKKQKTRRETFPEAALVFIAADIWDDKMEDWVPDPRDVARERVIGPTRR
jgi:uncharacterized protein YodC (DUF2158 family)